MINSIIHSAYFVLVVLCCLDIIYAYAVAAINKESTSKRLRDGLLTHIPILVGTGLLQFWAPDFGLEPVAASAVGFLILMYLKSLKETFEKAGGVVPKGLEDLFNKYVPDDPEPEDEEHVVDLSVLEDEEKEE